MKQIILKLSIIILIIAVTSCNNKKVNSQEKSVSTEQTIVLPELKESEENLFEDEQFRLVDVGTMETSEGDYNILKVQPKKSNITSFEMEGTYLSFETVIGNTLLVSEGTGVIRQLMLYDLSSGKEILQIEDFPTGEMVVKNDNEFYFHLYDAEAPIVSWNQAENTWVPQNNIPQELLESQELKEAAKNKENLFEGMQMMAQQKIHVNIKEKKLTPLKERKWTYIE